MDTSIHPAARSSKKTSKAKGTPAGLEPIQTRDKEDAGTAQSQ